MRCELCPRQCHALRTEQASVGVCGMGQTMVVSRAAPHLWEEPCISGTRGSGTVFFAGCSLRCAYCQNWEISHEGKGRTMTPQLLAEQIQRLEAAGVHNISFVTATHFVPQVLQTLQCHRPAVPVVWNSGGYERLNTLALLDGQVDVYLPDLKHVSPRLSRLLCGAEDYFEQASRAILCMIRQTGPCQFNSEGLLEGGVLIRHLVLPGCTADSIRAMQWIADHVPEDVPVSIMRQYTPIPQCSIPGMNRRVRDDEYARVTEAALDLGLHIYTQQKDSADTSYIPSFNTPDAFMERSSL